MEQEKDVRTKFLQAIDGDNPVTKLWKYRSFIQYYPKQAQTLKDRMLELAIKNKLPGEYESIYRLFGVQVGSIPRNNEYGKLKEAVMPIANNLKVEASSYQQVNKVEEEIRTYLRLGEMFAQLGDHKESETYYSKIIRRQTSQIIVKDEDYMPTWGKEMFYSIEDPQGKFSKDRRDYSELEIFAMREFQDKKKVSSTLALLKDIYNLTKKGRGKGRVKIFQNLRSEHLTTTNVMNNGIVSLLDLGFLYSILALAFLDRAALKQDIKWSNKLQISYLQTDYKKLLNDINRSYENFGKFSPLIRFVFNECITEITKRILLQVLSAYQIISLAKIQQLTGISPTIVQVFLRDNPQIPYLFDPITKSIVSYQKNVPLYEQALTFFRVIKQKFDEKQKTLLGDSKEEFEDDDEPKSRLGSGFGGGGMFSRDRMFM